MRTKHENSNLPTEDGILSNQTLRTRKVDVLNGNAAKQVRTTCNKNKLGYNGAAKVDSESPNQHGDVKMKNTTDTNYEVIQARVDSTEKVVEAGLAGHKAELAGQKSNFEGYKSNIDGKFDSISVRMDADRAVADAKHQVTLDRIDANLKAAEADRLNSDIKFQAMEKRMDANLKAAEANQEKSDIKFQAMEKRMDADRAVADAKHQAYIGSNRCESKSRRSRPTELRY